MGQIKRGSQPFMKTAFKELHQWVKDNPLKACVFSALTGILATWDGTRPYLTALDLIPWAILLIVVCWSMAVNKLMTLILLLCLLCPQETKAAEKPEGAGIIVGVVVVVVAGVVIIKVVNFCQNHFPRVDPPATNAPPSLEEGDYYAASMTYEAIGNCYQPASLLAVEQLPTVIEFSVDFEGEALKMEGTRKAVEPSVTLEDFVSELAPWGIRLGGGGEGFYALNGRACTAQDIPVSFGLRNGLPSVTVDQGSFVRDVVVERSIDLVNWETMLTMRISAEQRIRFSDASTGRQKFYRCRPL